MKKTAQRKPNLDKKTKVSIFEVDSKDLKIIAGGKGIVVGDPQP